jgi:hypothetical protein
VVGGVLSSGDSGGGGQTASKEPWADAAPWLRENLAIGQRLQGQYQANPFSPTQQQAYNNQFGNSDFFRQLSGSMLGQMNQARPFDRNNPSQRPAPFQFPQMGLPQQPMQQQPTQQPMPFAGGTGSMLATNPFSSPVLQPPPAPAPVAQPVAPVNPWADPQYASGWNPNNPLDFIQGSGY